MFLPLAAGALRMTREELPPRSRAYMDTVVLVSSPPTVIRA
jgi:hypothetical protein